MERGLGGAPRVAPGGRTETLRTSGCLTTILVGMMVIGLVMGAISLVVLGVVKLFQYIF